MLSNTLAAVEDCFFFSSPKERFQNFKLIEYQLHRQHIDSDLQPEGPLCSI